jgi:bifunctional non-homologous end joining protein LigD
MMRQTPSASTVAMTHPDRVMFEGTRYTKAEVADYYRAVSRWMLPELRNRPLSLVRCPDGAGKTCFFNKHHSPSLGKHVLAIALSQKTGRGKYLYVDSLDAVLELVQMSTLEFHPWGAKTDAPEKPDRITFDLDPGDDIPWTQVVSAAKETRDNLAAAGLESFVRLSGGKGLHVVAPIRPGPSWDEVRTFCQSFAEAMVTQSPERYVATMTKSKRRGRIFIDWFRNARGSTSVASWSLRARKGAPVAVPLRWEDLAKVRSAAEFDLASAKQRAQRLRSDPWSRMATLRQKLPV